uniref:PspA/IM30 family protein n=1 Tax=Segatella copri TaxID=165179 RepID=UPI003FF0DA35
MKRQLTSILLFSALLVGGASTFVSCTDHESDSAYNTSISLADAIAKQKAELTDLNAELKKKADKTTVEADKLALEGRIKANEDAITAFNNSAVGELAKYATLDAAIQGSKAYTDLKKTVDDHIKAIEELRKKDEEAAEKFTESLNKRLEKIEGSVSDEAKAREKVQAVYDQAFDYLVNKNLTSIAINATENPVLGYYNAAFVGSQLNLAASFYGTAQYGSKTMGVEQGDFLNTGDAGKIYVTLNPIDIAPECIIKLQLVDSQGNEAKGFSLGDLESTDKVLTYGYTRTAAEPSANGFYAIPVKAVDPANDDFSLNKGELKEAAKNVLAKLQNPKTSNLNLSQVATALYNTVNNKLKAYSVKATYYLYDPTVTNEDGSKGALVEKHQVAPTYNMAAFAVKPLSYNTLKDNQSLADLGVALDKYLLPTMSDKLGKFMNALDFQIKNENGKQIKMYSMVSGKNVYAYQNGKNVVIVNIGTGDSFTLENTQISKDLSGFNYDHNIYEFYEDWYQAPDGNYYPTYGLKPKSNLVTENFERVYVLETTDNTIDDLIGSINDQIGTQLQPVKDAIKNAATKWDNAITPVNNLLKKINANIGNVNKLLQPTLLYKSTKTNSWNVLSTLKGTRGTRMTGTGSTVLVATSWTGELLAPAYKKSVYVKENGATVTLMDGKTSAKTPFAGSIQKVLFNATKARNYTVVYKAVDYSGVETTKEYNITVE